MGLFRFVKDAVKGRKTIDLMFTRLRSTRLDNSPPEIRCAYSSHLKKNMTESEFNAMLTRLNDAAAKIWSECPDRIPSQGMRTLFTCWITFVSIAAFFLILGLALIATKSKEAVITMCSMAAFFFIAFVGTFFPWLCMRGGAVHMAIPTDIFVTNIQRAIEQENMLLEAAGANISARARLMRRDGQGRTRSVHARRHNVARRLPFDVYTVIGFELHFNPDHVRVGGSPAPVPLDQTPPTYAPQEFAPNPYAPGPPSAPYVSPPYAQQGSSSAPIAAPVSPAEYAPGQFVPQPYAQPGQTMPSAPV